jgi:hypothetical protein
MSVVTLKPDEKFEITPKKVENLPKIPKLLHNDENIQQRTFDIINGTVQKGTKSVWGLRDELGNLICDEKNPQLRILTIREKMSNTENEKPPDNYTVTYVYLCNDGNQIRDDVNYALNSGILLKFKKSIESTMKHVKKADSGVLRNVRKTVETFNEFWQNPFVAYKKSEFASVLLFCHSCEEDSSICSVIWGKNDKLFLPRDTSFVNADIFNEVEVYGQIHESIEDEIVNTCLEYLTEICHMKEDDARSRLTLMIHELREKKEHLTKADIFSYFIDYIEVPCFKRVSNLEMIHATKSMSSEYDQLKKVKQVSVLKNGSCTLNMALTMKQLKEKSNVFYLENAGGIAGCKCYTNAAATNGMVTMVSENSSAFDNLHELLMTLEFALELEWGFTLELEWGLTLAFAF